MKKRKATECDKLNIGEYIYFKRLITEVYPKGFVSIVSDTWDFWQVITEFIPRLKNDILARDGRFVVRPDSGIPEDIICGTNNPDDPEHVRKGAYECLWDIFGGTYTENGYKVLDTHIGMIYGDSITIERQREIYRRLEDKGFAATNLVLGIGSYTYQYRTRDSLGFAMKATWCRINGERKEIFKSPKTDSGMKKSLRGLISVVKENDKYVAYDCAHPSDESNSELKVVFENGKLVKEFSLQEVRDNVRKTI